MSRRPDKKPASGPAVAKGFAAIGAPTGVKRAVAFGLPTGVTKALPKALSLPALDAAEDASDLNGDYDLILVGDGIVGSTLAETRQRHLDLSQRMGPNGEMAVWLATFAAPLRGERPAVAYHALLFPESAAAGMMGPVAEATALSASGWMMLFHLCGLTCVSQAGVGETPLPEKIAAPHAPRLAVFDPDELRTGRFIARFRRGGGQP